MAANNHLQTIEQSGVWGGAGRGRERGGVGLRLRSTGGRACFPLRDAVTEGVWQQASNMGEQSGVTRAPSIAHLNRVRRRRLVVWVHLLNQSHTPQVKASLGLGWLPVSRRRFLWHSSDAGLDKSFVDQLAWVAVGWVPIAGGAGMASSCGGCGDGALLISISYIPLQFLTW